MEARAAKVRSAASRSAARRVRERAGEGSEATEPRSRAGRGLDAGTCKRSARSERERAQATGIVTRRAKTASAGFVEPGGAKPRPAE